jgi:YVTN family beta-propeller protein
LYTVFGILIGCSQEKTEPNITKEPPKAANPAAARLQYTVLRRLPHDVQAFTQGLEIYQGAFLESTGQYGSSSLRKVALQSGKVQRSVSIGNSFFGEGITQLSGRIYMLTWLNQQGFIYDAASFRKVGEFRYSGEGWGVTNDGARLYMSNGTSVITVIDPSTWSVVRTIPVSLDGTPVPQLNELEWVDGQIWANVWQSETIVRIDPATGFVTGLLDLAGILPASERTPTTDVLNGIAWDNAGKKLYVTGKNWPAVFELQVQ